MPPPTGRAREVVSAGAVVLGPGRHGAAGAPAEVRRLVLPQGQARPRRARRPRPRCARSRRRPGSGSGSACRCAGQRYPIRAGTKLVHYWIGRAVGDGDVGGYEPNAEIDEVAWFPIDKARRRLTYEFDIDTLDEALGHAQKTRTLVILRHSHARSRKTWRGDDREAPAAGHRQAPGRAARAGARRRTTCAGWSARRSTRCVQTLEPYAAATGRKLRTDDSLSEEDATPKAVRAAARRR